MCVIVFKPAGAPPPALSTLRECWTRNPDGAGFAVSCRKGVVVRKGFMTFAAFSAAYAMMNAEALTSRAAVFHFRIGTHGKKDAGNTHPFRVSARPEELRETSGFYPEAVAHNGVFQLDPVIADVSDTGQFIADAAAAGKTPEEHWDANEKIVGWSKMVVLRAGNRFTLRGSWSSSSTVERECLFSNLTWKPYVYTGGFNTNWRDQDEDFFNRRKEQKDEKKPEEKKYPKVPCWYGGERKVSLSRDRCPVKVNGVLGYFLDDGSFLPLKGGVSISGYSLIDGVWKRDPAAQLAQGRS